MELLFFNSDKVFYNEDGLLREESEESLEKLLGSYDESCDAFSNFKKMEFEAAAEYVRSRWIGDTEPAFYEDDARNYTHRTILNARWSDITLALAADFSSPGELTTMKAADSRYLRYDLLKDFAERVRHPMPRSRMSDVIVGKIKSHPNFRKDGLRINIAGNSQITLDKCGIKTEDVRSLVRCVLNRLKQDGVDFEVRSGGQTGVDEAGIKAAQDLGIKCSILAPNGFRMHYREDEEIGGWTIFTDRFREEYIDYEAWSRDNGGEAARWSLAGFNAEKRLEMLRYHIDLKIMHINAREKGKR